MAAETIDQVIEQLTDIMDQAYRDRSRLGFFAALYRQVTIQVKHGIANGRFADGPRMERLDVVFANRYLEAMQRFVRGELPPAAWLVAFRAASSWRLLILQHLLLGINAHINLDLGIAAAQVAPGDALPLLKSDFEAINTILATMLDAVQEDIGAVSPWLWLLDRIGGRTDEAIATFSLLRARDAAWNVAEKLAGLSPEAQARAISALDQQVAARARLIRTPGLFLSLGMLGIRLPESNDIPSIITRLA
jgi:hypothetical protein